MKRWEAKVYKERAKAMKRYRQLLHFLATAQNVDEEMLRLIREQKDTLGEYIHILDKRIQYYE